ncbi:IS1182 family transposase [Acidobacteria bacterium AH-259-O06]|nr:IS1182 family transposase [Acidobacteria bacterium AH-259-O06]
MGNRFKTIDRDTPYMFPPSVQEWLPEKHLARFVVEIVSKLDVRKLEDCYTKRGSEGYHPAAMLGLLFYGYATGVFSSRKLEQATYDSVAFRYIAGNTHPDHDTIANFRKRFLEELKPLFVEILLLAQAMGFLKLGRVTLDGTKVKANASKHSALSWGHIRKLEQQLREEVEELMRMAEEADNGEEAERLDIPAELARREDRLKALEEAKAKLAERAAERQKAEQAEYEEKMARWEAKRKGSGKKPPGSKPKAPAAGVRDKDQINLTDEESRIMPVSGGGFEQSYNAQAVVDNESLLIVAAHVSQKANDKKELEPALEALAELPEPLGRAQEFLADNGYFSEPNVESCVEQKMTPYIAVGRESHYLPIKELSSSPDLPREDAGEVEKMKHRLKTWEGRAIYAERKCTPEPVFGIIKSVLGFRQFSLRGHNAVDAEWDLVSIAWNLKRMHTLWWRQQQIVRVC